MHGAGDPIPLGHVEAMQSWSDWISRASIHKANDWLVGRAARNGFWPLGMLHVQYAIQARQKRPEFIHVAAIL